MKHLYTAFVCVLLSYSNIAQTVITSTDIMPTLGETIYTEGSNQVPPISYFTGGQNQNWDMTWFTASQQDTFRYVSTSNAINPAYAPNADFVKQSNDGDHFIAINDSAYVSLYYHSYLWDVYEYDYNLLYNLPMAYGNIDTTHFEGVLQLNGNTYYREVEHIQEVIGEGNLSTPNGYFTNCLQIKTIRIFRDSSASTQQAGYNGDTTYTWVKPGFSEVIFSISIKYTPFPESTDYYNYLPKQGILNTSENTWNDIIIAPNPSNGVVEIQNIDNNTALSIKNTLGQTLEKRSLKKGSNYLNLEHLPKGIYYLLLRQQNSSKGYKLILN